jgi:(2Fe-2S) ferredoxin
MDDAPIFFATRAHVLLCTGPRCSMAGSHRVLADATAELERRRVAYYRDGGTVRLTQTGCLGACSFGPTAAAYYAKADGTLTEAWYVRMNAEKVVALAEALHREEPPPEEGRFDR